MVTLNKLEERTMIIKEASVRERYILAQALSIAIDQLESVEPPVMRELSNIEDMKDILNISDLKPFASLYKV